MPLAGAQRAAMEAFWDAPPDMPQQLRDDLKAGCAANNIAVAYLDAVNDPKAPDFVQQMHDICDDAQIAMKSMKNVATKWRADQLSGAPVANVNAFIAQAVTALGGRGASQQQMATAVGTILNRQGPAAGTVDLGEPQYAVAMHMGGMWMDPTALASSGFTYPLPFDKKYKQYVSGGGYTLRGAVSQGQLAFNDYVNRRKAEAETRGETTFALAWSKLADPLATKCQNNWPLFVTYFNEMWNLHLVHGLRTPQDLSIIDRIVSEGQARAFSQPSLGLAMPKSGGQAQEGRGEGR